MICFVTNDDEDSEANLSLSLSHSHQNFKLAIILINKYLLLLIKNLYFIEIVFNFTIQIFSISSQCIDFESKDVKNTRKEKLKKKEDKTILLTKPN